MIDPKKTVAEVVFKQLERLTPKACAGILVDPDAHAILQREADKLANTLGNDISNGAPLHFHGMPIYLSPDMPSYTATLLTHKPQCLFCEGAMREHSNARNSSKETSA